MKHIRSGIAALRVLLSALALTLLASCGGGGGTPYTGVTIRPLPADFTSRKAIAYSPYRTSASEADLAAEVVPKANIKQDLDLLLAAGFRAIRLFDSSDKVARQTLEVIRDNNLNIKVQLGAFVLGSSESASRAEIARCVTLANEFKSIVLAVSVGNETMVSWAFNRIAPAVMAGYLRSVRSQITQPVTTDDNYAFWAGAPSLITDEIDFASLHTYVNLDTWFDPTRWEWKRKDVPAAQRALAMMDAAMVETRRQYQEARSHLDGKGLGYLPITIGETGWNAVDVGRQRFRAHPVNQKLYLDRLAAWATEGRASGSNGPKQVFYFEAFDEPWKQGDDKWGLFNAQRQARYAVQAINPPGATVGSATWVYEPVIAANDADGNGSYTDADAAYFQPPVVNAAVTASTYTLFSDAATSASDLRPTGLRWDAFDGNTAGYAEVAGVYGPGDASTGLRITPTPASYGWGLLRQSQTGATENLSAFAGGRLNFLVSTTYAGKIEIGISSDTQDREPQEAYLQIGPGDYGYCNTGAWCTVSIPLSAFTAANPKLDLSLVLLRFVVADRYAFTGKASGAGITSPIVLDAIRWSK